MLVITASFAQEGKSSETAEILRSLAAADALGISRRPPGPAGSRSVKFPRGRPLYEIKSAWQAPRNTGVCVLSAKGDSYPEAPESGFAERSQKPVAEQSVLVGKLQNAQRELKTSPRVDSTPSLKTKVSGTNPRETHRKPKGIRSASRQSVLSESQGAWSPWVLIERFPVFS